MAIDKLQIVLDAVWKGKNALDQAGRDLKKTQEETKKNTEGLRHLATQAAQMGAAVAAAGAVMKKAFDMSKEGANLNQLTESFDRMNASVYQTPDLLNQMSAAVNGTIKETDLMAGLLTLTAGASDEMSQQLAAASPRLLEIAKASNTLNPALGDTAFLYDSIAKGIKRGSPLILDNLGIIVSVTEANEKWAAANGVAVDSMTKEQQTMALLNATLESGGQLIDQVGGDISNQADAWTRLEIRVEEINDGYKRLLAEGLLPVMEGMSGISGQAAERVANKTLEISETTEELTNSLRGANQAYDLSRTALGRMTGTTDEATTANVNLSLKLASVAENAEEYKKALSDAGTDVLKIRRLVEESGQGFIFQGVALADTADALLDYARASKEAAGADQLFSKYINQNTPALEDNRTEAEKAADAIAAMGSIADDTQTSYASYTAGIREAQAAQEAETKAMEESIARKEENAKITQELAAATGDYFTSAIEAGDEQANMNSLLYDAADAAGADAEALAGLMVITGDYTKEQINAALQTAAVTAEARRLGEAVADGTMTVHEATEALNEFANDWTANATINTEESKFRNLLRSLVEFDGKTFRATASVNTSGSAPSGDSSPAATGKRGTKGNFASGGDFIVPPGYPNDSYRIGVQSGERVTVTPAGQTGGNGVTIQNLNITVGNSGGNGRMLGNQIAGAVAQNLGELY